MQQALTQGSTLTLPAIRDLLGSDWPAVDQLIMARLASDVVLVNQIANYIVGGGGKRLRPLLVLLVARACRYAGRRHVEAAVIVEFIHTATLLHDDVVDESDLRRGRDTANQVWGNQASVLVGDFLYSRAFQMMVTLDDLTIMDIMAEATNTIAEGEVLQLMNIHDPDTTEERYRAVIYRKTARLFEAGAEVAAVLAGAGADTRAAMAAFGRHLGTAFQLVDDALDYRSSAEELGKNIGDDLAEGKPTLPLIHAMRHAGSGQRQLIRDAIEHGGLHRLEAIQSAIRDTGALEYTLTLAQEEAAAARRALAVLHPTEFRTALEALTELAVDRRH